MTNRRAFLKSIAPVAAVAMLPSIGRADGPEDPCEYHARCLAEAMKTKNGGDWNVKFDKSLNFVLICR